MKTIDADGRRFCRRNDGWWNKSCYSISVFFAGLFNPEMTVQLARKELLDSGFPCRVMSRLDGLGSMTDRCILAVHHTLIEHMHEPEVMSALGNMSLFMLTGETFDIPRVFWPLADVKSYQRNEATGCGELLFLVLLDQKLDVECRPGGRYDFTVVIDGHRQNYGMKDHRDCTATSLTNPAIMGDEVDWRDTGVFRFLKDECGFDISNFGNMKLRNNALVERLILKMYGSFEAFEDALHHAVRFSSAFGQTTGLVFLDRESDNLLFRFALRDDIYFNSTSAGDAKICLRGGRFVEKLRHRQIVADELAKDAETKAERQRVRAENARAKEHARHVAADARKETLAHREAQLMERRKQKEQADLLREAADREFCARWNELAPICETQKQLAKLLGYSSGTSIEARRRRLCMKYHDMVFNVIKGRKQQCESVSSEEALSPTTRAITG